MVISSHICYFCYYLKYWKPWLVYKLGWRNLMPSFMLWRSWVSITFLLLLVKIKELSSTSISLNLSLSWKLFQALHLLLQYNYFLCIIICNCNDVMHSTFTLGTLSMLPLGNRWNYAITSILEEDVRRRLRNWSWTHMKEHRYHCRMSSD